MTTSRQPKAPTVRGPAEWFTGTHLNLVRFTPGAHTARHEHAVKGEAS